MATATIRELRNSFPRVRKLLDAEGEVVVTEQGAPAYLLTRYTPAGKPPVTPKDYLTRLRRHQPKPLTAAVAKALDDANRGPR